MNLKNIKLFEEFSSTKSIEVITTKDHPELSFFEKYGIHKVAKAKNAHGGIVYVWNIDKYSNSIYGVSYLDGWWYMGLWYPTGRIMKRGEGSNGWDDLYEQGDLLSKKDELKDNKFIDPSDFAGDTEKLSDEINSSKIKGYESR